MTLGKTSLMIISISIIAGIFSINPSSFGQVPDDLDGDGIFDNDDNCPLASNPLQEDIDENGIGDVCQDVDGDKFLDLDDNCPFIPNPTQADSNENGIGDACEEEIELLVNATFPVGNKINVKVSNDPKLGIFSASLGLPKTQGGEITIKKTDAGETPGNFSFLGSVIDFKAPCTDVCEISFTFTQASLDTQGITLEQVTIFHDMNGNGSFETEEAIPTIVTGDGPFTATSSASFTSKFSVGGIKALALGALAGGSSRGGSAPTLESISFSGVNPIGDENTLEFGGIIIDKILSENNLPTQTIQTGESFELRLPFYEDGGVRAIQHVAVYILQNGDKTIDDSKTFVIYEPNTPLQISDPYGYTSSILVETIEKSAHNIDVIFEMTFQLPMNASDIIVRSWDNHKRSSDIKFNELIQVIESPPQNKVSFQTIFDESDPDSIDDDTIHSTTVLQEKSDNALITFDTEDGQSITSFKIPPWVKNNANWWAHEEINDEDFVAGIQFLIDHDLIKISDVIQTQNIDMQIIPAWIKSNAGWWAEGILSDEEFMQAMQWLIEKKIILLFSIMQFDYLN